MSPTPFLLLCLAFLPQGPGDGDGELARKLEQHRAAVIAKVAPAVCSVMSMKSAGGGSGVLIDPAGHALTNFHVVGELERKVLKIGLPDGFLYLADVLGVDPGGDIALIRLRPREPGQAFPAVELGDSNALKAGELTYAMGNPFLLATDFSPTVTMGIVSGTHRFQGGAGPNGRMLVYPDCIQVDTPVNPGNSGGPLFNERGELVGINGRISVRDRGRVNTGVGFAVSMDQIKKFLPDLRAGRHCEHGTLDMNTWFMTDPNTRNRHGVFVQGMLEDSVAAKAGLRLQDEILEFCGERVRSANQLATLIGILPAGFEVLVKYQRYNEGTQRYDEPASVQIALAAMDTGSAKADTERLAAPEFRAWERDRILRKFAASGPRKEGSGIVWKFQRKDLAAGTSAPLRIARLGAALRIDDGDETTLLAGGKAFAVKDGKRSELDEAARIHLERLRDLHPLLAGAELSGFLGQSLLEGGIFVQTRLASVLALPEEGRRAVYFDEETSTPSGCRFRSPMWKAELVEIHVGMVEKRIARVIVRVGGAGRFELTPIGEPGPATPELFKEGS